MEKFLIIIFLILFLYSCDIPGYHFIRNYSQKPVTLLLVHPKKCWSDSNSFETEIRYSPSLIRLNHKALNMKEKIKVDNIQYKDSEVVASFVIPPHSTVDFGFSFGIRLGCLDAIMIKKEDAADTITNKFHWRYRAFLRYFKVWYDEK
jgi:hypothetical protein